jgi:uncharacterized membrane protein SpoIIM required for sporulation
MSVGLLRSTRFRKERERHWRELARIVDKVERGGVSQLTSGEVARLPGLYRQTLSALSAARAISLDRNLLDFLGSLAARGFFAVYGTRHRFFESLVAFFGTHFPRSFRRYFPHFLVAVACLVLGAWIGWSVTDSDPERYFSVIDRSMAQGRTPSSTPDELRRVLYDTDDSDRGFLPAFASFLIANNVRVGMLCFTFGIALGIPVVVLLVMNGMILGAMTQIHVAKGLGVDWWAWVAPHGVTELSAICLCGAAGLALGQATLFPGELSRRDALLARGREAGTLVGGAIGMLVVAGLIEGIVRQTVHPIDARFMIAGGTTLLWSAYFLLAGRRVAPAEAAP